jgi:hypothetical protein
VVLLVVCAGCGPPGKAEPPPTIDHVALGAKNTCAAFSDSTAQCWGGFGNPPMPCGTRPTVVPKVGAAFLGGGTACFVGPQNNVEMGDVYCWDTCWSFDSSPPATKVPVFARPTGMAFGPKHGCGFGLGVACWTGELLYGPTFSSPTFDSPPSEISDGADQCALFADGSVQCWTDPLHPQTIALDHAFEIAGTQSGDCARLTDGVYCWSHGTTPAKLFDATDTRFPDFVGLVAGDAHFCMLFDDSSVSCWGDNTYGQLGDGTNTASAKPVPVSGISGAIGIAAGGDHSCAWFGDRTVKCWGRNDFGQLGDGTQEDRSTPVPVRLYQ